MELAHYKKVLLPAGITLGALILVLGGFFLFRPRTVRMADVGGSTQWRASVEAGFVQAQPGQILPEGAELRTGRLEGAQLVFDDDTILRMAPYTDITIAGLGTRLQSARITLSFGQVYIILRGKELQMETAHGKAVVSGSYMGVSVDPLVQATEVTCLEGSCSVSNDLGATSLVGGQTATITGEDQAPSDAQPMTLAQVTDWESSNPEAEPITGPMSESLVTSPTYDPFSGIYECFNNTSGRCDYTTCQSSQGCFSFHFENNCRGGEESQKLAKWYWIFYANDQAQWFLTVLPGQTADGWLPLGYYKDVIEWELPIVNVEWILRNSWQSQTFVAGTHLSLKMCPDDPELPTGRLSEPLTYYFANNCVGADPADSHANTVWHWVFFNMRSANPDDPLERPLELVIPPGESVSGVLPPGIWLERDWTENGAVDNPLSLRIGGKDNVSLCPDQPPLPDAP